MSLIPVLRLSPFYVLLDASAALAPEPASVSLLALGGLALLKRKRR